MINLLLITLFINQILSINLLTEGNVLDFQNLASQFKPVATDDWMYSQYNRSILSLTANISPEGTPLGTVIASPSRSNPDYYYHWTRDAALVMQTINRLYEKSVVGSKESLYYENQMFDYARLVVRHQKTPTISGLGEPKFYVDGRGFDRAWGRPQNDGPALRIITLGCFIKTFLKRGGSISKVSWLYKNELPAKSPIKVDLEYISHVWPQKSVDLWEEVLADHFYTRIVQQNALSIGIDIAILFNDPYAADYYKSQLIKITESMEKFWDPLNDNVITSLNVQTIKNEKDQKLKKPSALDVAILLGVLHTDYSNKLYENSNLNFQLHSDRILISAAKLLRLFEIEYQINQSFDIPLTGRYPGDVYNGNGVSQANPWILSTHAFAEFIFKLNLYYMRVRLIKITKTNLLFFKTFLPGVLDNLKLDLPYTIKDNEITYGFVVGNLTQVGSSFVNRVHKYTQKGFYTEQIHRVTGKLVGAPDLTWSYASFITMMMAKLEMEEF
ncbi:Six-hairpin glycosidase-like protein [Globomyces pollinis-pini]|nr:Six-hairpin glycosidase-like protein [Globomyces pollinis-pini]